MGRLRLGGGENKEYIGNRFSGNLDYEDKIFLCSAACQCEKTPLIAKDGSERKQDCMSMRINALAKASPKSSFYKAEVNYDMTQAPPEPVLESCPAPGIEPQRHPYLPGWITKYWNDTAKGRPSWQSGCGYIKRPDVIIVHDPLKSPVQSNIKTVVEVKFPNDTFGKDQIEDYIEIAGSEDKVAVLLTEDCGCSDKEREREPVSEPAVAPAEEISAHSSQARAEVQQEADNSYAYYDGDNVMHVVASPLDDNENSSSYNLGKFFYLSAAEQRVLAESSGMALAALATIVAYSWLALLA
ncbi:VRR-NUC domain-containing protein [Zymobacter palmae]|uniref:Predicted transcriptional regulators n=1 Tax=Zymobacter palmae TaxID=33074 RepID=A0A348HF46_9GAMM|nr:VRR-NUC domain-containing protein [Zymobacter palmae]BBG30248.1 predicted transcriptional regulators [Zymobacter palmae]